MSKDKKQKGLKMKKTALTIKNINTNHFVQCIQNLRSDYKNAQKNGDNSEGVRSVINCVDSILKDGMSLGNITPLVDSVVTSNSYQNSKAFSNPSVKLNIGVNMDDGYSYNDMLDSISDEHLVMKTFLDRYYAIMSSPGITIVDLKETTPSVVRLVPLNEKQRKAQAKRERKAAVKASRKMAA